ncbi:MAG: hypothetical protein AAF790_04505 [Planctomycetota bacterium]
MTQHDTKPTTRTDGDGEILIRLLGGFLGAYLFGVAAWYISGIWLDNGEEMLATAEKSHSMVGGIFGIIFWIFDLFARVIVVSVAAIVGSILGACFAPRLLRKAIGATGEPTPALAAVNVAEGEDSGWLPIGVATEGAQLFVSGYSPWGAAWQRQDTPPIELPHPHYPEQMHSFTAYLLPIAGGYIPFAAAEVSPGVWAFYGRGG